MAKETQWVATKQKTRNSQRGGQKKIGLGISNGPKKSGKTTVKKETPKMEK